MAQPHVIDAAELFGGRLDDEHAQQLLERPAQTPIVTAPQAPVAQPKTTAEPVSLDELATNLRARLAFLDGEIARLDQLQDERNKVRRLLKAIGTED